MTEAEYQNRIAELEAELTASRHRVARLRALFGAACSWASSGNPDSFGEFLAWYDSDDTEAEPS